MCKYCEKEYYNERIDYRTCSADDNSCDVLSPDRSYEQYGHFTHTCDGCDGCVDENNYFDISFYDGFIQLGYFKKTLGFRMESFSERFEFNFCPMCGRKFEK